MSKLRFFNILGKTSGNVAEVTADDAMKVDASTSTVLPLPTGASTEATLAAIKAKTDNLDVALSTRAVTGLTDTELRATPIPISA
jgi:hypothetical protein